MGKDFRLAVIGSRDFNNYEVLSTLISDCHKSVGITHIISGGAKGADTLGAMWAHDNEIELVEYLPDYNRYGKKAPIMRNTEIIEDADAVIAFWDGKSRGTSDAIRKANNRGLDVFIYNTETRNIELLGGNHG